MTNFDFSKGVRFQLTSEQLVDYLRVVARSTLLPPWAQGALLVLGSLKGKKLSVSIRFEDGKDADA